MSYTKPSIVAVVGDAGSAEYLLPVLPKLREFCCVEFYVDPAGAAKKAVESAGEPYVACPPDKAKDYIEFGLDKPDLVLCGTAGKAQQAWRAATLAAQKYGVRVAWFGDFFGSGCESALEGLSPDYMLLFDHSSKEQFLAMRPSYSGKALVVGNPAYDKIATFDRYAVFDKTRASLNITDTDHFVVYSASSMKQFKLEEESLTTLVPWALGRKVHLAVAFHPADDPAEVQRLKGWLREKLGEQFVDHRGLRGLELLSAADLVITDYSTEGVKSAVLGIPTCFLMLDSVQKYQESRGMHRPYFPILDYREQAAMAKVVFSQSELSRLDDTLALDRVKTSLQEARKQPRFSSFCDGKGGERFVSSIKSIFG